jgi:C-terminal processing protease CtpA/Prc
VPDFGDRNFPPPDKDDLSPLAWLIDRLGRYMAKFDVEEATQSDAGIGYIRLTGFVRPYLSAEKFAAAMDRVADSKALIIDLRENSGGNRDSVALLASYFFDQPTHLSEVVAPRTGERLHMWTRKDIEGRHYGSTRPVHILTSHATCSAGEDFAYAMQTQKRAIIVGEATWGGAHPMAPFRLSSHFVALIPVAETTSPVTHTNWEGVGVQPDIVVRASDARSVATTAILKQQLTSETDATRRAKIQVWLQAER